MIWMLNMLELSKSVKILKHPNFQKTPNGHKKARCDNRIQMCLKCELSKRPSLLQQHWCILGHSSLYRMPGTVQQYNQALQSTVQYGKLRFLGYGTVQYSNWQRYWSRRGNSLFKTRHFFWLFTCSECLDNYRSWTALGESMELFLIFLGVSGLCQIWPLLLC